jgi:hypothetical protein
MADQTMLQRIAAALIGRPANNGVSAAAQALNNRAYQLHVQEARAMGQQPMTPQQFAAQQAQPQQVQQPEQAPAEPAPFRF